MALEQFAKEVCDIKGKIWNRAYYLFLSLVTCKELKMINLFGPLLKEFFLAQVQARIATSRPQNSIIFNPCTDLVSVKL